MLGMQLVPTPVHYGAGSGRTCQFTYPNPADVGQYQGIFRGGLVQTVASVTVGSGGKTAGVWKGVDCAQLFVTASVAADRSGVFVDGNPVHIATTKGHFMNKGVSATSVYRVVCTLAGHGLVLGNTIDYGVSIVCNAGVSGGIYSDALSGIGIVIRDGNSFDLVIRGPNGVIRQNFTGIDTTFFHCYEFRFYAATTTDEARLSFLLDGVRQSLSPLSSQWDLGGTSNLPPSILTAGRTGFVPRLINQCGIANGSLFIQECSVTSGPTEEDVL